MPALPEPSPGASPSSYDDPTVTAVTGAAGFRTVVHTRGFSFVADEPASAGGTEQGPTPYDLLAAALAACTGMTLRMYADRKGWPLGEVTVRVAHDRVHAEDCATCETEEGHVDRLTRRIALSGPLTDEQRTRLLQIADRCPVHRSIHAEIHVLTEMVSAGDPTL
jgi:putative redox protein